MKFQIKTSVSENDKKKLQVIANVRGIHFKKKIVPGCYEFEIANNRYQISKDNKNEWEVAIWANRYWSVSTGRTPEGTFKTFGEARLALLCHCINEQNKQLGVI